MRDRQAIPLPVLAVLLVMPAIMLAGIWQMAEANEPSPNTIPPPPTTVAVRAAAERLTTPLLSMRREPDPIAERAAAVEAERRLAALTGDLAGRFTPGTCLTMRRGDETIIQSGDADGLIPASNMKLLVAAVALDVLGPDHRFRTELRAPPPTDGVVAGDVHVVGGGDPVLVTADHVDPFPFPAINTTPLEPLIDQLVEAGVNRIEGDVVGDASRYDDEFRVPTWGDHITSWEAGPYDALMINDGLIGEAFWGLVPAQSAANIVVEQIRDAGITVTGSSRHGPAPDDVELVTLAAIESEPLSEVVVELLHTSDNNTAELLLKEIGYQARGEGTRVAGAATMADRLATWEITSPVAVLDDGSGLSRNNRLTCDLLADLLALSPVADELVELLPVAARDGTLANQLVGTPADGRLLAKTGTLTGVKALSGVMDAADGGLVAFSLILNGESVDDPAVYEPYWLAVIDAIAQYPIVVDPDPDRFAPR